MTPAHEKHVQHVRAIDADKRRLAMPGIIQATRICAQAMRYACRTWELHRNIGLVLAVIDAILNGNQHWPGLAPSLAQSCDNAAQTGYGRVEASAHAHCLQMMDRRPRSKLGGKGGKVSGVKASARMRQTTARVVKSLKNRVQSAVEGSLKPTPNTQRGSRAIRKAFESEGMSPAQCSRIETLYRTETSAAYEAGREAAFDEPSIAEILWGFTWSAINDDRCRPTHRAMNGCTAPKEHPVWKLWKVPAGHNCRCSKIELYKDQDLKQTPIPPMRPDPGFEGGFKGS